MTRLMGSFISVILPLMGCGSNATVDSTDVNENKIFQHYSVDYDPDAKELTLFAQFALGNISGTTIRLTPPSTATVDTQAMTLVDGDTNSVNLIGTYYRNRIPTDAPNDSYTFKWIRTDGKSFENVLSMARPLTVATPEASAVVSKSNDLVLTFEGDEIRAGETVYFDIKSDADTADGESDIETTSIRTGRQATIPKTDLSTFANGPAKIYATRLRTEDTQQGNEGIGGKMFSHTRSLSTSVTVID